MTNFLVALICPFVVAVSVYNLLIGLALSTLSPSGASVLNSTPEAEYGRAADPAESVKANVSPPQKVLTEDIVK